MRDHYRKEKRIDELFEEDLRYLNPLPAQRFDVITYERVRTNGYGKLTLNGGKHSYSTSPRLAASAVTIGKTYNKIIVLDKKMKEVVIHKRLYGNCHQESMNWLPYLTQLSKKPRALKYTGIYRMFPESAKSWFEKISSGDKSSALKLLAKMSEESGFEVAIKSLESALSYGASDFESLSIIYKNITSNIPELKPIQVSANIPKVTKVESDVKKYDLFLNINIGKGDNHVGN